MTTRIGTSVLITSLLSACGAATIDGRFTEIAIDRAAEVQSGAEVTPVEAPGGDGSVYQFTGKAGERLCFTGTIDNRDGRARADRYRVRLFGDTAARPLKELEASTEIVREHMIGQPGVARTNQYVVGPDGAPAGEIVELTEVGYPVADVKICFEGIVEPESRVVVLNRMPKSDERSAPSYAAWKR